MPVRFKGDSEYHEHYKWLQSPKSATFSPTRQQASATAGLSSPQVSQTQGFMDEPAILRKKKPIPLVTTSTTKMFDEEIVVPDDYMLLGSQEKFTPNIQYKDYLTKNRTRVLGTTYVAPAKPADFEELQSSPKKPLAQINFDTGAPKRKDGIPSGSRDEAIQVNGTAKPVNLSKTRVIAKEPAAPVSPPQSTASSINSGPTQLDRAGRTFAVGQPRIAQAAKWSKEPTKSRVTDGAMATRKSDDRSKTAPAQDQNIDRDYVMKYRAGISPKRVNPKRKSEYEYKYDWKKPIDSTPLLAAEQVVHNRNPQIGPYKVAPPKNSEYSKEFKAWKYKPVSQDDSATQQQRKNLRGSKMRRTRSATDLTPDRRPAAGSPSRIHHDNTRLTQSLNPQKPFFPHRRTVSWTTEYKSNFQPFSRYEYDQGAWRGAAPPHVKQQMIHEPDSNLNSSNWTAEVTELREKAEEYRKRSNGTHFSRAHVAQLLSNNSKLWDAASVSSDLSALDLEHSKLSNTSPPQQRTKKQDGMPRQRTQSAQAGLRSTKQVNESVQTGQVRGSGARKRLAWSSDGGRSTSPSDSARSICSASTPTISSTQGSYKLSDEPVRNKPKQLLTVDTGSKDSQSSEDGRVQTPEIANSSVSRRHHLDITTPNRHGLMLSSPPHRQAAPRQQRSSTEQMRDSRSEPKQRCNGNVGLQVKVPASTNMAAQPLISPTYGKPTPDTHALLNEEISEPVDMILETRYVQSPQPKARPMKHGKAEDKMGDPWKYHLPKNREDDECSQLSNSMMSVISSASSLASEVLERAAQRQQFWKKAKA